MTRWVDTLPEPVGHDTEERFNRALTSLLYALAILASDPDWALVRAAKAASEIRAWRKSMPDQGERIDLDQQFKQSWDDRLLLQHAMHHVLFADQDSPRGGIQLRYAEAALRELWQRHQEVVAP